jgi:hypothetical protein
MATLFKRQKGICLGLESKTADTYRIDHSFEKPAHPKEQAGPRSTNRLQLPAAAVPGARFLPWNPDIRWLLQ